MVTLEKPVERAAPSREGLVNSLLSDLSGGQQREILKVGEAHAAGCSCDGCRGGAAKEMKVMARMEMGHAAGCSCPGCKGDHGKEVAGMQRLEAPAETQGTSSTAASSTAATATNSSTTADGSTHTEQKNESQQQNSAHEEIEAEEYLRIMTKEGHYTDHLVNRMKVRKDSAPAKTVRVVMADTVAAPVTERKSGNKAKAPLERLNVQLAAARERIKGRDEARTKIPVQEPRPIIRPVKAEPVVKPFVAKVLKPVMQNARQTRQADENKVAKVDTVERRQVQQIKPVIQQITPVQKERQEIKPQVQKIETPAQATSRKTEEPAVVARVEQQTQRPVKAESPQPQPAVKPAVEKAVPQTRDEAPKNEAVKAAKPKVNEEKAQEAPKTEDAVPKSEIKAPKTEVKAEVKEERTQEAPRATESAEVAKAKIIEPQPVQSQRQTYEAPAPLLSRIMSVFNRKSETTTRKRRQDYAQAKA